MMNDDKSNLDENLTPDNSPSYKKWLKRFGVAGFLFFFLKGLAWIAFFVFAGKCAMEQGG